MTISRVRPGDEGYTMHDLAELTGVSPRTVRRYRDLGLLPPPFGRKPNYHSRPSILYTGEHLRRLRLIRDRRVTESLSDMKERFDHGWHRP